MTDVRYSGLYEGADGALLFVTGTAALLDQSAQYVLFRYVSLPTDKAGRDYHVTYALPPDAFSAQFNKSKKLYNL